MVRRAGATAPVGAAWGLTAPLGAIAPLGAAVAMGRGFSAILRLTRRPAGCFHSTVFGTKPSRLTSMSVVPPGIHAV